MKRLIALIFCCLSVIFATANDGVFYAEGNQLIPITETDISVRKEVLTINRVGKHLEVTVYYEFYFPYVLTAANRWANHQIDDFTLNINMGDRESFMIRPDFFKTADEWVFTVRGKTSVDSIWVWEEDYNRMICPNFHIQEGGLSFHKANFHPEGELHIYKRNYWSYFWSYKEEDYETESDALMTALSKEGYFVRRLSDFFQKSAEDSTRYTLFQQGILKNLPYAYRGYIFKDKTLQDYFESCSWYLPNPEYKGDMEGLTEEEKKWVEFWK